MFGPAAILAATFATLATSKTIVVTVADNKTATNASAVFTPQEIHAVSGDVILFNFTQGNHTATQSTFPSPCIPEHDTNVTLNGFDSDFRPTNNGTAITQLSIPIDDGNVNTTIWFFDFNTCAIGGVGVINPNDSTLQTLAGFTRNAVRLNGTGRTTSLSHTATSTGGGSASSQTSSTSSSHSSDAQPNLVLGALAAVPLLLAALASL